jgi:hypothetical protein
MDEEVRMHMEMHWQGKQEITVCYQVLLWINFPLLKKDDEKKLFVLSIRSYPWWRSYPSMSFAPFYSELSEEDLEEINLWLVPTDDRRNMVSPH